MESVQQSQLITITPKAAEKVSEFMKQEAKGSPHRIPMKVIPTSIVGMLAGIAVGFWLRPSAPLVGQLPLSVVISGGDNLHGIERALKSIAETSLNYMWAGLLVGAAAGAVAGYVYFKEEETSEITSPAPAAVIVTDVGTPDPIRKVESIVPKSISLGDYFEEVESVLGKPEKSIYLGAKVIYVYKDMKIIFVDGKVSDVQ